MMMLLPTVMMMLLMLAGWLAAVHFTESRGGWLPLSGSSPGPAAE